MRDPQTWAFLRMPQTWAIAFLLLSIASTVAAVVVVGDEKTTVTTTALFATIAGILQLASAYLFSVSGRVSREYAATSVRHIAWIQRQAISALELAEQANLRSTTQAEVRKAMGYLSRDLDWIQEGLTRAGEHWVQIQPHANDAADTPISSKTKEEAEEEESP